MDEAQKMQDKWELESIDLSMDQCAMQILYIIIYYYECVGPKGHRANGLRSKGHKENGHAQMTHGKWDEVQGAQGKRDEAQGAQGKWDEA